MPTDSNRNRTIMLICCVVCSLLMGFCYAYSIIQPAIMEYYSIDSSSANLPYTIFLAVFVLGNYIGGTMQKKRSLKTVMLFGYLMMAAGIFATSLLPSDMPALMWVTYGGLFGIGDGVIYNVIMAVIQKWFPDKKGLATGIILAVLGLSATILSPFCSMWLARYGLLGTFRIMTIIFVAIGIFGTLTLRLPPPGYMADFKPTGAVAVRSAHDCVTAMDCFRTKEYYLLVAIYFCAVPAYVLLSAVFVSYGVERGVGSSLAVTSVAIASMMQVAGRFLIPTCSDKVGRKKALVLCFGITILAVVMLNFSVGMLYVACFWMLSFTYGGASATLPPMITDYLGSKNPGLVISLAMIGLGTSSLTTSFISKAASIQTTFVVAGIVAVLGVVAVIALPRQGEEKAKAKG